MVPDDLVLNNTLQIVYNSSAPPATAVDVQAAAVLDDTKFMPVLEREMVGKDVEFRLDAYFDVGRLTALLTPSLVALAGTTELIEQTYDDGTNRASCTSRPSIHPPRDNVPSCGQWSTGANVQSTTSHIKCP